MNHMLVSYSLHIYRFRAWCGGDFGLLSAVCVCVLCVLSTENWSASNWTLVHSMNTEYLLNEIEHETSYTLFSSSVSYLIEVPVDVALVPSTKKKEKFPVCCFLFVPSLLTKVKTTPQFIWPLIWWMHSGMWCGHLSLSISRLPYIRCVHRNSVWFWKCTHVYDVQEANTAMPLVRVRRRRSHACLRRLSTSSSTFWCHCVHHTLNGSIFWRNEHRTLWFVFSFFCPLAFDRSPPRSQATQSLCAVAQSSYVRARKLT